MSAVLLVGIKFATFATTFAENIETVYLRYEQFSSTFVIEIIRIFCDVLLSDVL